MYFLFPIVTVVSVADSLSSFLLSRVTFCRFLPSLFPELLPPPAAADTEALQCTLAQTLLLALGRPERALRRRRLPPLSCRKCPQNKGVICPFFTARKQMVFAVPFGEVPRNEIGMLCFVRPLKRREIIST